MLTLADISNVFNSMVDWVREELATLRQWKNNPRQTRTDQTETFEN